MEGTSDVSTLKMLNHELVKLDCFDGTNFSRWKDKIKFILTALKLFYVLDPNLIHFPIASDEVRLTMRSKMKDCVRIIFFVYWQTHVKKHFICIWILVLSAFKDTSKWYDLKTQDRVINYSKKLNKQDFDTS